MAEETTETERKDGIGGGELVDVGQREGGEIQVEVRAQGEDVEGGGSVDEGGGGWETWFRYEMEQSRLEREEGIDRGGVGRPQVMGEQSLEIGSGEERERGWGDALGRQDGDGTERDRGGGGAEKSGERGGGGGEEVPGNDVAEVADRNLGGEGGRGGGEGEEVGQGEEGEDVGVEDLAGEREEVAWVGGWGGSGVVGSG